MSWLDTDLGIQSYQTAVECYTLPMSDQFDMMPDSDWAWWSLSCSPQYLGLTGHLTSGVCRGLR